MHYRVKSVKINVSSVEIFGFDFQKLRKTVSASGHKERPAFQDAGRNRDIFKETGLPSSKFSRR